MVYKIYYGKSSFEYNADCETDALIQLCQELNYDVDRLSFNCQAKQWFIDDTVVSTLQQDRGVY